MAHHVERVDARIYADKRATTEWGMVVPQDQPGDCFNQRSTLSTAIPCDFSGQLLSQTPGTHMRMKLLLSLLAIISSTILSAQAQVGQQGATVPVATAPSGGEVNLRPLAWSAYSVVARGPHHRVMARVTWTTNSTGWITARTNSYTELATGMNTLKDGKWVESST